MELPRVLFQELDPCMVNALITVRLARLSTIMTLIMEAMIFIVASALTLFTIAFNALIVRALYYVMLANLALSLLLISCIVRRNVPTEKPWLMIKCVALIPVRQRIVGDGGEIRSARMIASTMIIK